MIKFKPIEPNPANPFQLPLIDSGDITRKWSDVDYTPAKPHPMRKLDIYLPETGDGPFPTIVCIHGGAFRAGTKDDMQVAAYFDGLDYGFAVVSVEQRLCNQLPGGGYNPEGRFPNPVFDYKAAIRFLRANADEYKLDPNRFAVAGGSAGGYHCAIAAASADNHALSDLSLGYADVSERVQAAVDWFGVGDLVVQSKFTEETPPMKLPDGTELKLDNYADVFLGVSALEHPELARFANPETWVTRDMPPIFIQHGIADEIVPIECSRLLAKTVERVCGKERVLFEEFEGYTHGDLRFNAPENTKRVFEWLKEVMK
ncbi:MAG: alpha/beta hydrolase [Oscillospiraceae bacterium]|jgi:acetyl esterase/lipase|nr:alpha/beta hydrolase [Oscillospiraceae bacterium]